MNCGNCGNPLIPGNDICPTCGAKNILPNEVPVQVTPEQNVLENTNVVSNEIVTNNSNLAFPNAGIEAVNTGVEEKIVVSGNVTQEVPSSIDVLSDVLESVSTEGIEGDKELIINDEVVNELNEEDVPQITENMAPPTLDVQNENLMSGATDLGNSSEIADYDPNEQKEDIQEQIENRKKQEQDRVDIAIPEVVKPEEVTESEKAGTVPEVSSTSETVGDNLNDTGVTDGKKKLKIKLGGKSSNVTLIIIAIIALAIGVLVGKSLFSKNYCATANMSYVDNKTHYVADGKNNETIAGNYKLKIPTDYTYDRANNGVYIYGADDKYRIFIKSESARYKDLTGSKTSMKVSIAEQKLDVLNVKEIKSGNTNFLAFEVSRNGDNRLLCFADANNDNVFYIEIIDIDNNYNYEILSIVADIIENAEMVEVNSNMEKRDTIDVSKVSINSAILQQQYQTTN